MNKFDSVNDAARIFEFISDDNDGEFIIIIDEFEYIVEDETKSLFASLAKKVSDNEINVRFIFCGIGRSVEELLGIHLSAGRYIAPVQLERLSVDALSTVIEHACAAIPISINGETKFRISQLSDGFPYFVHLVCEHMLWAAYDSEIMERSIRVGHFRHGISEAIKQSFVFLKSSYEGATKKYNDDYEQVLWALADKATLTRQTSDIYEKSYLPIMLELNSKLDDENAKETLDIKKFRNRLNSLKTDRHGCIITPRGAGWYEFTENMIRGYVRLRANENGIDLGADHH